VHRLAGIGSDRGIRLVLNRLVAQGIVVADEHPDVRLYVANRRHLAWPAIEAMVGLRATLFERLRERIEGWSLPPLHASIFGSTARGDGHEQSDIDLLLVRPEGSDAEWEQQLDSLRDWVLESTGNRCQTFDVDRVMFTAHVSAADPLVDGWRRESIHLAGVSIEALVRSSKRRSA
jgi:predicted nucleotidyltransferase